MRERENEREKKREKKNTLLCLSTFYLHQNTVSVVLKKEVKKKEV